MVGLPLHHAAGNHPSEARACSADPEDRSVDRSEKGDAGSGRRASGDRTGPAHPHLAPFAGRSDLLFAPGRLAIPRRRHAALERNGDLLSKEMRPRRGHPLPAFVSNQGDGVADPIAKGAELCGRCGLHPARRSCSSLGSSRMCRRRNQRAYIARKKSLNTGTRLPGGCFIAPEFHRIRPTEPGLCKCSRSSAPWCRAAAGSSCRSGHGFDRLAAGSLGRTKPLICGSMP